MIYYCKKKEKKIASLQKEKKDTTSFYANEKKIKQRIQRK